MNDAGSEGTGVGLDSMTGALRLLVGGVNQLNDDDSDFTGEGAAGERKNDGAGGDAGFWNPNIRATMLGEGALAALAPLLGGGGENSGLRCAAAASGATGLSTTRDHRMESSGRKQMQKRKK